MTGSARAKENSVPLNKQPLFNSLKLGVDGTITTRNDGEVCVWYVSQIP